MPPPLDNCSPVGLVVLAEHVEVSLQRQFGCSEDPFDRQCQCQQPIGVQMDVPDEVRAVIKDLTEFARRSSRTSRSSSAIRVASAVVIPGCSLTSSGVNRNPDGSSGGPILLAERWSLPLGELQLLRRPEAALSVSLL